MVKYWKKTDLKNAFNNGYLNIKILFGYIEMKRSLDVYKLVKGKSLIYMQKQEIILGTHFSIFYH